MSLKARLKTVKRERAEKRAKRKKTLIIGIFALVLAAVIGYFAYSSITKSTITRDIVAQDQSAEIYSYGRQIVVLKGDGSFTANLSHGVNKSGTYTKTVSEGTERVMFNVNGRIETGRIVNNSLHLPHEWDDGHGHGSVFKKNN